MYEELDSLLELTLLRTEKQETQIKIVLNMFWTGEITYSYSMYLHLTVKNETIMNEEISEVLENPIYLI